MPNRKQIRRRRFTALGLIVVSIALLTAYFNEAASGALHSIQRGAMEVLSPLQDLASGAIKPARDLVNWVGDSFDAKSENKKLKRQLTDARIQAARLQQADSENKKLRALVGFNESDRFPGGRSPVVARVIVRSPTDWFARVTIDKGSSAGVRVNQPVIADGALAGKVTSVSGHAAQVTLLTDSSSGVGAVVSGKNILGIVQTGSGGEVGAEDLQLSYIRQRGTIRVGNMVVTSGTVSDPALVKSLFPAGIPIGSVSKVDLEERQLYGRVHLTPFADMRDLRIVEVLTRGKQ
ncbi:MAG: rod shape-determining protein MreC [Actinobacteria bacterium]|nr:rod shape-determining protein MreC [Actinomycetota bacterium]